MGAGPGPGAQKERDGSRGRRREASDEDVGAGSNTTKACRAGEPGPRRLREEKNRTRARHRELGEKAEKWGGGRVLVPGLGAQPLTAAVARLCMLGAAAALLSQPDAPDPRPSFSTPAAENNEPP
ncbi:hypothetical protein P7K49_013642 [Saguinus oedipus]|uniref:Uncharacterized protein n=1 Tax=Saguinus oedipus TaxID=9490 RepID=A0ABQ9VGX2_SAGOE|nr:hypothetical protein P7K49_013642 [Saguinus oedipus]